MQNYSLLPSEKTFRKLLIPFFAPYFLYVGIESLPAGWVNPEIKQLLKLIAVSGTMIFFVKSYRFGALSLKRVGVSLAAAPAAIILWVLPLFFFSGHAFHEAGVLTGALFSQKYFLLRCFNSIVLAAVFEELFVRVYLMQWFYQAGTQTGSKSLADAVLDSFDQAPASLSCLPFSRISIILTTLFFTVGHGIPSWVSAVLYFSFTTWVYKKTGSLWVCILIHALTNLGVALLVKFGGMHYLWL